MITAAADPSTCEDRNPGCPQWARNGYCYTMSGSVVYVQENCPFSCNFCPSKFKMEIIRYQRVLPKNG